MQANACRVTVNARDFFNGVRTVYSPSSCSETTQTKLFMLGDSHAGAYGHLTYTFASREALSTTVFSKGGCRLLAFPAQDIPEYCQSFVSNSIKDIVENIQAGDVLILPGLHVPRYRDYWDAPLLETAQLDLRVEQDSLDEVIQTSLSILSPVLEKGASIILELPKPLMTSAAFRCADPYTAINPYCHEALKAREDQLTRRQPIVSLFEGIATQSDSITVWDPFPLLCSEPVCEAFRNGVPIYSDTDHLSTYGNDLIFPSIRASIMGTKK